MVAICDQLPKLKYSSSLPYVFTEHSSIAASQRETKIDRFLCVLGASAVNYFHIVDRRWDGSQYCRINLG